MADLMISSSAGSLRAVQFLRPAAGQSTPSVAAAGTAAPVATNATAQSARGGATSTFAGGLSQSTLLAAQTSEKSALTGLTEEEEAVVAEMKQTDAEIRAHEMAHLAAGGQFATGPTYEYDRGPDGGLYVVAGEVHIDTSPVAGDPEATIAKAEQVRAAALAPGNPSAQDRAVANAAAQMAAQASAEAATQKSGETDEDKPSARKLFADPAAQAASNAYDAANAIFAAIQQATVNLAA